MFRVKLEINIQKKNLHESEVSHKYKEHGRKTGKYNNILFAPDCIVDDLLDDEHYS